MATLIVITMPTEIKTLKIKLFRKSRLLVLMKKQWAPHGRKTAYYLPY